MANEIKLQALKENVEASRSTRSRCAGRDGGQGPAVAGSSGRQGGAGRAVADGRPRHESSSSRAIRSRSARSSVSSRAAATAKRRPRRRPRRQRRPLHQVAPPPKQETPARPQPTAAPTSRPRAAPVPAVQPPGGRAGPATRRLARELGIDLSQVNGSGRAGRVVEEDVKAYVRQAGLGNGRRPGSRRSRRTGPAAAELRGMGAGRTPAAAGVRKATARQMSLAWSLIPHVTQHDLADITDLEAFRKAAGRQGAEADRDGLRPQGRRRRPAAVPELQRQPRPRPTTN